jgi:phosphatidylinositol glycan class H protein
VFIHEAFKGFEVRFYLAVVVKGEVDVVVVFPRLRPRRAILEDVWRGTRACLFGGGGIGGNEKETSMET